MFWKSDVQPQSKPEEFQDIKKGMRTTSGFT